MASSDRAFRALAQAEPDVIVALEAAVDPGAPAAELTVDSVDDPTLHAPPPALGADFVARAGDCEIRHVECQGYREADFPGRVWRYHLTLVLRYPSRRVRTTAIWLVAPPARQGRELIESRGVRVRIRSVVLGEVPAARLLANPKTACFAPGSDAGTWTADQLCARVARSMKASGATLRQHAMALVAAASKGRYGEMVSAMRQASMEPVLIEELVRIGEDLGFERGLERGLERGREEGLEEGQRASLRKQLVLRFGPLPEAASARVSAAGRDELDVWAERVLTAPTLADVLGDG